jgi:hypothetical protein
MSAVTPIHALEEAIKALPEQMDFDELTSHHFCNGLYARELFVPAGVVAVGKTHAQQNLFFLLKGTAAIVTPDGPVEITAPFMSVTAPGTKRCVYAITDCLFMNVHPNADDERDLLALEHRYITPEALPAPEPQGVLE